MDNATGEVCVGEILRLAERVCWVRPLTPYPDWRFDADWDNPGFAFQMRRLIWSYCHARKLQVPMLAPWYHGLRVYHYLGNDMTKQLFIGGCNEPNELAFLSQILKPGMTLIDGGANEGLFTLLGARCVGAQGLVWSFEPSQREYQRLHQNVQVNQLSQVRTFPMALGRKTGTAELRIAEDEHSGQNTLGDFAYQVELARSEQVALRSLDDLLREECLGRVDVVKLDVEGAEVAVLEGARDLLQRMKPVLMIEVFDKALRNQGASSAELVTLLRSLDYVIGIFGQATGQPTLGLPGETSDNIVAAPKGSPVAERIQAGTTFSYKSATAA